MINYTRSISTAALLGFAVLVANTGTSHAARDKCDYYAGNDAGKRYASRPKGSIPVHDHRHHGHRPGDRAHSWVGETFG